MIQVNIANIKTSQCHMPLRYTEDTELSLCSKKKNYLNLKIKTEGHSINEWAIIFKTVKIKKTAAEEARRGLGLQEWTSWKGCRNFWPLPEVSNEVV